MDSARAHMLPQTYRPLAMDPGSLARLMLGAKVSGALGVKLGYLIG